MYTHSGFFTQSLTFCPAWCGYGYQNISNQPGGVTPERKMHRDKLEITLQRVMERGFIYILASTVHPMFHRLGRGRWDRPIPSRVCSEPCQALRGIFSSPYTETATTWSTTSSYLGVNIPQVLYKDAFETIIIIILEWTWLIGWLMEDNIIALKNR